jgi:hypothetical protein
MTEEMQALAAQNLALREALEIGIESAHPHPTEHPTMTAAWAVMRTALALPLPDAAREVAEMCEKAGFLDWLEEQEIRLQCVYNEDGTDTSYWDCGIAAGPTALAALRAAKGKAK